MNPPPNPRPTPNPQPETNQTQLTKAGIKQSLKESLQDFRRNERNFLRETRNNTSLTSEERKKRIHKKLRQFLIERHGEEFLHDVDRRNLLEIEFAKIKDFSIKTKDIINDRRYFENLLEIPWRREDPRWQCETILQSIRETYFPEDSWGHPDVNRMSPGFVDDSVTPHVAKITRQNILDKVNIRNDGTLHPPTNRRTTYTITGLRDILTVFDKIFEDHHIVQKPRDRENMLSGDHMPHQMVMSQAMISKRKETTDKIISERRLPHAQRVSVSKQFNQIFYGNENQDSLTIFSDNYTSLNNTEQNFQHFLQTSNLAFSDEEKALFDENILTNQEILHAADTCGAITDTEKQELLSNKRFKDWNKKTRDLFGKLATHHIPEILHEVNLSHDVLDETMTALAAVPEWLQDFFNVYKAPQQELHALMSTQEQTLHNQYTHARDLYLQDQNNREKERDYSNKERAREKLQRDLYHRRLRHKIATENTQRPDYAQVDPDQTTQAFQKLKRHHFAVTELSLSQQNILLRAMIAHKIIHDSDMLKIVDPEFLDIDPETYQKFLLDLYDLEKETLTIPAPFGDLNFHVSKSLHGSQKSWLTYKDRQQLSEWSFPFSVNVKIDDQSESFFDTIWHGSETFFMSIKDAEWEKKIGDNYLCDVTMDDETCYEDVYLSPHGPWEDNDTIDDTDLLYMYRKAPPTRLWEHEREIVLDDNGRPITINRNDVSKTIAIKDKSINIQWSKLARLVWGFTIGEHGVSKDMTEEEREKIQEKVRWIPPWKDIIDKKETDTERAAPVKQQVAEFFSSLPKYMWWANHLLQEETVRDHFVKGATFLSKWGWESLIPPAKGNDALIKWKVHELNLEGDHPQISLQMSGTELDLGTWLEGKIVTIPLEDQPFAKMQEIFGDMYFMPQADNIQDLLQIIGTKEADFGDADIDDYHDLMYLQSTPYGFESKIAWMTENDKEAWETVPVQYFQWEYGYMQHGEGGPEPQKWRVLYKITKKGEQYHVSWQYIDQETKAGTTYNVKYKYNRIMDMPSLTMFLTKKKLIPRSDKQAELLKKWINEQETIQPPKRWNFLGGLIRGFFSAEEAWKAFKNVWSGRREQLKGISKKREDDFESRLVHDVKILEKAKKIFWNGFPFSDRHEWLDDLYDDYLVKRGQKAFDQVKGVVEYLEGMWDKGKATNVYVKWLLEWVLSGAKVWLKARRKVMGALIFMCKKNKATYARKISAFPRWSWVKALLWDHAHKKFQQKAQLLEAKLAKSSQDDSVLHWLNRLEIQFIVDNIRWWWDYGEDNNMISEELKNEFEKDYGKPSANTLLDEYDKNVQSIWGIDDDANTFRDMESFSFTYQEFESFLQQNRVKDALAAFKGMAMRADGEDQIQKTHLAAIALILTWTIRYDCDDSMKDHFIKVCRSINFLPWIWSEKYDGMSKLSWLFDFVTDGDFTNQTGYKVADLSYLKRTNKNYQTIRAWGGTKQSIKTFWSIHGKKVLDFCQVGNLSSKSSTDVISLARDMLPGEAYPSYKGRQLDAYDYANVRSLKELLVEAGNQNATDDVKNASFFKPNALGMPMSYYNTIINLDRNNPSRYQWDPKTQRTADKVVNSLAASIPKGIYGWFEFGSKRAYILKRFYDFFPNETPNAWQLAMTIHTCKNILTKVQDWRYGRNTAEYIIKMTLYDTFFKSWQQMVYPDSYKKAFDAFVDFITSNLQYFDKKDIASWLGEDAGHQRHQTEYFLPITPNKTQDYSYMQAYAKSLWYEGSNVRSIIDQFVNTRMQKIDDTFQRKTRQKLSSYLNLSFSWDKKPTHQNYRQTTMQLANQAALAAEKLDSAPKQNIHAPFSKFWEHDYSDPTFETMTKPSFQQEAERLYQKQKKSKKNTLQATLKDKYEINEYTIQNIMNAVWSEDEDLIRSHVENLDKPDEIKDAIMNDIKRAIESSSQGVYM